MIRLRAHHILCILTYVGRGYSPAYIENMDDLVRRIHDGEAITLVEGPDDICAPALCADDCHCYNASVTDRDRMAAADIQNSLGLIMQPGRSFILSDDQLNELRAFVAADAFAGACLGCPWKELCADIAAKGFQNTRLLMA